MAKVGAKAGWTGNYVESIDAAKTLYASDSGKVFMVTHTGGSESSSGGYTITIPTPSAAGAGWTAKFIVNASVLSDEASEDVILNDGTSDAMVVKYVDAADSGTVSLVSDIAADTVGFDHTAVKGDYINLFSDGTTWFAEGASGADGGILVAT